MVKKPKIKSIDKILLVILVLFFLVPSRSAYADMGATGGEGEATGSGSGSVWRWECMYNTSYIEHDGKIVGYTDGYTEETHDTYAACPLWIKVTADTFKSIIRDGHILPSKTVYSNLEDTAKFCADSSKNPSGIVVFAGIRYVRVGDDRTATSCPDGSCLTLLNDVGSDAKDQKWRHHNIAYDATTGERRDFFGDVLPNERDRTYGDLMEDVIDSLNTDEKHLAAFCQGMDSTPPPEYTDITYEDARVYIDPTHTVDISNIDPDASNVYYRVLPKETESSNITFSRGLTATRYDDGVSGKRDDALSRAFMEDEKWGTGTHSLANGEKKQICDIFLYPTYVQYKITTTNYYKAVPILSPSGAITGYEKGDFDHSETSITYDGMGPKDDSAYCVDLFREAEALFGIESSATAYIGNIVDYTWDTGTAHAAPSDRTFTTPFSTGPVRVDAATDSEPDLRQKIFLTTNDSHSIILTYNHQASRGLNTTYESRQPESTTISSPWSIGYTIDGVVKDTPSDSIATLAPYSGLATTSVATHARDLGNGEVSFGTYDQQHCEALTFKGGVTSIAAPSTPGGPPTVESDQDLSTTACLHLYRPWNFDLTLSTSLSVASDDDNILIADDSTGSASVRIENHAHLTIDDGDAYDGRHASRSPDSTQAVIYAFVIGGDVEASRATDPIFSGTTLTGVSDIESTLMGTIQSVLGESVSVIGRNSETYSSGIGITGSSSGGESLSVSYKRDAATIDSGNKICVVAAVNYADSTYITDAGHGEGYGNYLTAANVWRTSNISCRTVTSKSLLQIHGGDIMTGGTIDAAAMRIGDTTFNSWSDYGIVAIGDIRTTDYAGISSGAFGAFGRDTLGSLNPLCDIAHITVANDKCRVDADPQYIGSSGVHLDTKLTDSVISRFSSGQINGVTIYDIGSTTSSHNINYVDDHISDDPVSGSYYYLHDLEKTGGETYGAGTHIMDHGTEIIRVSSSTAGLIITDDLEYSAKNYLNPFDIPQRIIVVESGNIIITPNVTHIDAWLIAKNGNIVTCADLDSSRDIVYAREHSDHDVCENQLNINGYVAADYIAFERTTSAQPSLLAAGDRDAIYMNYGERITLPYSSMIWAYNKLHISNISQPSVVYTHTLAPRY